MPSWRDPKQAPCMPLAYANSAAMSGQEVWIARPGELITSQVEELATRVGGLPLFPAGSPQLEAQHTTCGACGQQLALILQVHAAAASASAAAATC